MIAPVNKITASEDLGWFPLGYSVPFASTGVAYVKYDYLYNFLSLQGLSGVTNTGSWTGGAKRLLVNYTWNYQTNSNVGEWRHKIVHKNSAGTVLKESPYVGANNNSNRSDFLLYSGSVPLTININNGDTCWLSSSYVNITSGSLGNYYVGFMQVDEL